MEIQHLKTFRDIAQHFQAEKTLLVDLFHLKKIRASSLTDREIEVSKADLRSKEVPSSYVPFRNANLLASAVSWAEAVGAGKIYIGAVEEDSSGYPDCRRGFFDSYERMIKLGTVKGTNIRIITPIINLSKKDIVRKSLQMKVPLELTWSCYKSSSKACGECDSCALRLRGFRLAGAEDRIPYAKRPVY